MKSVINGMILRTKKQSNFTGGKKTCHRQMHSLFLGRENMWYHLIADISVIKLQIKYCTKIFQWNWNKMKFCHFHLEHSSDKKKIDIRNRRMTT